MLLPQTIISTDNLCTKCDKPLTLQVATVLKMTLPNTDDAGNPEATFTLSVSDASCLLCGQRYPAGTTSTA